MPAPALQDSDVQRIVELAAHRLVRSLQQRGVLDSTEADALAEESPLLSALSSASVQGQLATGPRAGRSVLPDASSVGVSTHSPSRRRLGWAALLARVFAVDVTRCPRCGGRLGLVAVLSDPASIGRYLSGVGLAAEPPPPRELDLVF